MDRDQCHEETTIVQWVMLKWLWEVRESLKNAHRKLDNIMAAQDDVNAAIAALQSEEAGVAAVSADLQTAVAAIQAELAGLQASGVDTSGLNAAVAGLAQPMADLQAAQASVDALAPAPAPAA